MVGRRIGGVGDRHHPGEPALPESRFPVASREHGSKIAGAPTGDTRSRPGTHAGEPVLRLSGRHDVMMNRWDAGQPWRSP